MFKVCNYAYVCIDLHKYEYTHIYIYILTYMCLCCAVLCLTLWTQHSIDIYTHIYIVCVYVCVCVWQPTTAFLPGKFHGQRSLVGCSPCGRKELITTEHSHLFYIPTGNVWNFHSSTSFPVLYMINLNTGHL